MQPSFHTPLKIEYLDGTNYRLLDAFSYDSSLETITVPAGFATDFASVPKVLWNLLPPTGPYGKAAVIHDFLYRTYGYSSKIIADAIFYEAMTALHVPRVTRSVMYLAVHLFGGSSYKGGLA